MNKRAGVDIGRPEGPPDREAVVDTAHGLPVLGPKPGTARRVAQNPQSSHAAGGLERFNGERAAGLNLYDAGWWKPVEQNPLMLRRVLACVGQAVSAFTAISHVGKGVTVLANRSRNGQSAQRDTAVIVRGSVSQAQ